jgi:hypothetical protein
MPENADTNVFPELSAPALRAWQELTDHVLRGIVHSLNNRASAIAAVLDLANDPAEAPSATISILGSELERVQELVTVVRLISATAEGSDAFTPADAARDAQRVLAFHANMRDHAVDFDVRGVAPTRTPRWMFVRALIALGADASRAGGGHSPVRVVIEDDGDWIVARAESSGGLAEPSPFVSEIANAMGGESLPGQRGVGFRVPTLVAIRQRERR